MKVRERVLILLGLLVPLLLVLTMAGSDGAQPEHPRPGSARPAQPTLIDDFSSEGSAGKLGARWEFVSDRTVGGLSSGKIEYLKHEDRTCLHLTGSVSAKNSGGLIQARVLLSAGRGSFDARRFKGIRLSVKGNGHPYALHVRTSDTRLARQFYEASFPTNGNWQDIEIPFTRFVPKSLRNPLNLRTLRSVSIVAAVPLGLAPGAMTAATREFEADIFVDEIAFYRESKMYKKLTPEEERVIIHKGTERPFTGEYTNHFEDGTYTCKQCGAELFDSSSKFHSNCGWPSFDDQIPGTVRMQPDADGVRTEILCANCGGHLGHVFMGERLTAKNTRYCVNSISMGFVPAGQTQADQLGASTQKAKSPTERAIFASGCFWGTEYHLQKVPGVLSTTVGYTGGHVENPTYKQVCTDKTGHAEAVEVIYDPSKTTYEKLARLFFETHNFTQLNRQGPDVGKQYRSAIFYLDDKQKEIAFKLVGILKEKGFDVKTEITKAGKFWPAEQYHQDYYKNNGKTPYCHIYRKIF